MSRTTRVCVGLIAGLVLAWVGTYLWLGYPWTMVGSSQDGLHYLWMAQALSDTPSAFGTQLLDQGRFPPGYPAYLALFGASTDSSGMRLANLAQAASVFAMIALVFGFARAATGSGRLALLVLGGTLAHPMMTPWSLELFAEPLFTSLLLAACWIAQQRPDRQTAWVGVAALVGLASLVRSMGLALLPAVVLWVWMTRRAVGPALAAFLVGLAPHLLWRLSRPADGAPTDSYLAQFLGALPGDAVGLASAALLQASSFVQAFAPAGLPPVLRCVLGLVLLVGFGRVAWMQRRQPTLPVLASLMVMALLLAWPFPAHLDRLAGPVIPLMLVAVLQGRVGNRAPVGVEGASTDRPGLAAAALALGALCAALVLLWRPLLAVRDPELRPWLRNASVLRASDPEALAAIHHASLLLVERLGRVVPPGQCVSTAYPAFVSLRSPVPIAITAMPFAWSANPCRYLLAINLSSAPDGFNAYYPMPLPAEQFRPLLVSRASPEGLVYAALIEAAVPGHH